MKIDRAGNIILSRGGDFIFPIEVRDTADQPLDLNDVALEFAVENAFTLVPTLDAGDHTLRRLHLTEAHAAQIGRRPRAFVLRRLLAGQIEQVLWTGTIAVVGFDPA